MSRRPQDEEKLTKENLDELQQNLAHLSIDAVRRFYERAHEDWVLFSSSSRRFFTTLVLLRIC